MVTIIRQMLRDNGYSEMEKFSDIPRYDAEEFLTQTAFDAMILDNPHWLIKWNETCVSIVDETCGFRLDYTLQD